ncbi:hypothetical protein Kpol_1045p46 [Vanderwaltozyma polyspora DSM 70294]|uniref:non-specific serine/threonine protein kinase n=1 Tax=Vanderwaltozyma polyspora (strain ATCC 22028 / DSM 70294 / BCRC 21397 / CBS 2163 / NBRC 10782 / NRRL Y-8283 / UCD 57-17) TaxID=436907 RepID=A7TI52_VANPO|nr:uncharacterized protein Kpol_1045p46 [Vanderwaltozyma polyspora DSM 70294]EDO18059.1 hypothetical protein Kpol_1045p46 [Vanderwaltozyma polyspora DSM 70294]
MKKSLQSSSTSPPPQQKQKSSTRRRFKTISKFFNSSSEPTKRTFHNPSNYFDSTDNNSDNSHNNGTSSNLDAKATTSTSPLSFYDDVSIISTASSYDTNIHPVQELQKQIEDKQKNSITVHQKKQVQEYSKTKKSLRLKRFFKKEIVGAEVSSDHEASLQSQQQAQIQDLQQKHTNNNNNNNNNGDTHHHHHHHHHHQHHGPEDHVSNGMMVTTNEGSHSLTYKTLYESDNINDLIGQYGTPVKKLGEGATGSVSVVKNPNNGKLYAIKLFTFKGDTHNKSNIVSFSKKVTTEFCIGSTLHQQNVVEITDMLQQEENGTFMLVMGYEPYDFFNLVMSGLMTINEINCYFKQLCSGVNYLHSMGIAHRDLKLDNCVVGYHGILKIIDFGSAAIFKTHLNDLNFMKAYGIVGSDPYLAPELLNNYHASISTGYYDPRPVDVWSIAIIYYCMITKRFPWKAPRMIYNSFRLFCEHPRVAKDTTVGPYRLLKALPKESRSLLGEMVLLDPRDRILIEHIVEDPWFESIECCGIDKSGNLLKAPVSHNHHLDIDKDDEEDDDPSTDDVTILKDSKNTSSNGSSGKPVSNPADSSLTDKIRTLTTND